MGGAIWPAVVVHSRATIDSPFAVDLDTDQLGMGVALEGCEQVTFAAGAVDDGEVAARQLQEGMGDLLGACVGRGLMPSIGDVGQGSVGHGCTPCVMDEGRKTKDGGRWIVVHRPPSSPPKD